MEITSFESTTVGRTENLTVFNYTAPTIAYVSVAVQIFLILVIFCGNLWVLVLIGRFRQLRKNLSNYFAASMAVADFLLSLAMMLGVKVTLDPFFIVGRVYVCLMLWCSITFTSTMSVLSLLCISVDRLIKIAKPLRYHSIVTEREVVYVIGAIWTYGMCTVLVPPFAGLRNDHVSCFDFSRFFNYYHIHYLYIFNCLIPFIALLVIYSYLFVIVKEKQRTSHQFEPATMSASNRSFWRKELRTLTTLAVIFGFTGIAWLPSITLVLLDLHFSSVQASLGLRTVLSWFLYLNSGMNPILYALRSDSFRSASRQIFTRDVRSVVDTISERSRSNKVNPSTVEMTLTA